MTYSVLKPRRSARLILTGILLASTALTVSAGGKHHPLEKMLDHIDLTEQQEEQAEGILARLPKASKKERKKTMFEMLALNPSDADYIEQANNHARKAGERVTEQLKASAEARKEIYEMLTPEQRDELDKRLQKKLARVAKRMEKWEED